VEPDFTHLGSTFVVD